METLMKTHYRTHRNPISLILALILLGGTLAYTHMQKSLFPEITFPKIKIIADNGLQPVDKMMITVTKPLENVIKQVPNLQDIRSITSRGSCEISAYMKWNSNIDIDYQNIQAKINQIRNELPAGVKISVEKMNPSILQVMGYALQSTSMSPIDLTMLATYTIKPYLSQVPGVAQVAIVGGQTKEYWLELEPKKMSSLGITPAMITQSIQQSNFIKSNGYLNDYRRMYLTVTKSQVNNLQQLNQLVISNNGKRTVRLQDVANVAVHPAIQYVRINADGKPSMLIGIIKQPNANLIDVSDQVKAKMASLEKILPKGVTISPYYVQADFVHDVIRSVSDALWIGLLLAIIVAIIFLRSWEASVTILLTIPITLGLSLIVMYMVGYTLNIMTLGALAASIGLIIDDAIVVVEQIHRTKEEHQDAPAHELVHKAISYLFSGMLSSSASTIVIFLPFIFLSGVAGAYFKVMANTMIIVLTCSFLVSWIGLPVLYLLISPRKAPKKKPNDKAVKRQAWVTFFIHRPYISLIFIAVLVVLAVRIIPSLQTGFLPEMDEGAIVLDYSSPPGTSLQETNRMCEKVEKIILSEPDVASYSRRTGTQMGFFITEPNTGDYLIELKKNRKHTTNEVINDIRKKIDASLPALRVDFGQVISDMLGDLMSSVQPIEIKIFGSNQDKLNQLAKQVAQLADSVQGTADVFDGIVIAGPSLNIKPDNQALAQYGLTAANLQNQIQTQLQGTVAGSVLEKEQMTKVRLIYPGALNQSVSDIRHTEVFLPNGMLKPIASLADIQIENGAPEIQRENLQTISVVSARLANRDLGSTMKDLKKTISEHVSLPEGYHISYGGAYAQQQQSFKELMLILITACLLVFCVMLFLSKDFITSLLILLVAILGTAGCVTALYLAGTALNVGSYTGIIMIVGIIGENAIFTYLQFVQTLQASTVDEAITYAISTRLRPKLMTALGAIIALMPLALGIGTGAQLHQPLAIAVIGGFIIALPLLLIVLPSLLRIRYSFKKL